MTPGRVRALLLASSIAVLLAAAPAACADTFCVSHAGCSDPGHNLTTVQAAVDAAATNNPPSPATPTRDTILVGAGTYDGAVNDAFNNPVDVFGSGRWVGPLCFPSKFPRSCGTLIRRADGNSLETVHLGDADGGVAASSLHDLSVRVSTGQFDTGVRAAGLLDNVAIFSDAALTTGTGLITNGLATPTVQNSSISVSGSNTDGALLRGTIVENSSITAPTAVEGAGATVRRSTIDATHVGVGGEFTKIEDSVVRMSGTGAIAFNAEGIGINNFQSITVKNVTATGDGSTGSVAARAHAEGNSSGSNSAKVDISSSILRGFATNFERSGHDFDASHTGHADMTVSYSDYDASIPVDDQGGPGSFDDTNPGGNTSADPGFVSATDLHLTPTSSLIDRGDPKAPDLSTFPGPPDSTADLDGLPRKVDGDGDGKARVDVGAFEFQQKRPTITSATANPSNPLTRQRVVFTASASDADGEPVTIRWRFGDRTRGTGASVSHRYTNGGKKTVTVMATDSRGLSRSRQFVVDVRGPAIRIKTPAGGAHYKRGKRVTASYSCSEPFGPAKIVSCKGPVADGHRINTSKPGRRSFTVSARDKAGNKASRTVHYTVSSTTAAR